MKNTKLTENPVESNVKLHISGVSNRSIVECRLLDVNNQIEKHADEYGEFYLNVLKYERCELVKRVFGE